MQYVILLATDPSSLSTQVNALIAQGWQPQNGVALSQIWDDEADAFIVQWAQAMTKQDADETQNS